MCEPRPVNMLPFIHHRAKRNGEFRFRPQVAGLLPTPGHVELLVSCVDAEPIETLKHKSNRVATMNRPGFPGGSIA